MHQGHMDQLSSDDSSCRIGADATPFGAKVVDEDPQEAFEVGRGGQLAAVPLCQLSTYERAFHLDQWHHFRLHGFPPFLPAAAICRALEMRSTAVASAACQGRWQVQLSLAYKCLVSNINTCGSAGVMVPFHGESPAALACWSQLTVQYVLSFFYGAEILCPACAT